MQDLSQFTRNGMWVTSQAGGNMTSSNSEAQAAPGSVPVDPLPDRTRQDDPHATISDTVPVGTPPARVTTGGYVPAPVMWRMPG